MATTTPVRPDEVEGPAGQPGPASASERDGRAFLRWAVGAYLVSTAAVLGAVVVWLGGHVGYVLDDPAIHLAMAENLVHHGTWGVAAGHFQSASSSPLWTVLMAAGVGLAPPARDLVPILFNVAAGLAVLAVLARPAGAAGLVPGRRRPLDSLAVVVLVVTMLFLPGLAVVAMEHTLHMALVVAALAVVHRTAVDGPTPRRDRLALLLIALATLARFETAFVAAGLALGLLAVDHRRHARRAAGLVAASAVPALAFALFNKAMGGGWLPNSILVKGQGAGNRGDDGLAPVDAVERLALDPVVLVLFALAVGYVFLRWRRGSALVPACTVAVACLGHVTFADIGWFERYQAYLIGLGAYLLLVVLPEVPARSRQGAVAAFCLLALLLTSSKAGHLINAPRGADDMYRHQYQAGRFLHRYYDGQPVATDQLGYISMFHQGPLTDFAGLGDYDVIRDQPTGDDSQAPYWAELADQRGFRVAVLYDLASSDVPDTWVAAGSLTIDGRTVSSVTRTLKFYATTPDEVAPLQEHLRQFEPELPDRVALKLNGYAPMLAARARDRLAEQGGP